MNDTTINSLTPKDAYELVRKERRAIFVDVRSSMEFFFVGHPVGAIHVPWIDEPDWEINPEFVPAIRRLLLEDSVEDADIHAAPIVLICRSGVRSLEAAKCLVEHGFHNLYNVLEGFEGDLDDKHQRGNTGGWRYHKLPWEQC